MVYVHFSVLYCKVARFGALGCRTAIHLPEDANLGDIKAHLDAGIIHVHVGKSA
jgi:hypothetical protein